MEDEVYESALGYFQAKVAEKPFDADCHHYAAVLFANKRNTTAHAYHSRIAVLTKQGGPEAANEMALSLMHQDRANEAIKVLKDTIKRWPSFHCAYTNLAAIYAKCGRYKEALPLCDKAVRISPADPALHRNHARVLEKLGRTTESLQSYRRVLKLDSSDEESLRLTALQSLSKRNVPRETTLATYGQYRSLRRERYDLKL